MSNSKKLQIGLVGFGVVGKGLYDVLQATPTLQANIKKICIKNAQKKRAIDAYYFTTAINELLDDESINVIVELIDDATAAYDIVTAAFKKGKHVVSANKKMIATHFKELLLLQQQYKVAFLYEAACCAGIPIIRNLEEYYDNDLLSKVSGIVNGSTNFILSKIAAEGLTFEEALYIAQHEGFAESNPALDIEGHDAANKLTILAAHAFGTIIATHEIIYTGITQINPIINQWATQHDYTIKLLAHVIKVDDSYFAAFVLPQLVKKDSDFYNVNNEFNALETESCFADKHFFKGKGAGAFPTAAAVLSDIAALRYDYKYEYKKIQLGQQISLTYNYHLNIIITAKSLEHINLQAFTQIEVLEQTSSAVFIKGKIAAQQLIKNNWWKENGVSLVLAADAIAVLNNKVAIQSSTAAAIT
ncbi:homoserine dehydrogenase [Ferruginibacter yonginensis]|uniref:Homoserine dehydrogenase n=1 Tax=Ferruginibacter yonginensis TaxID=1310416 RepID=A0ABV8QTT2_9BACT